MRPLTPRQERFCQELVKGATQSTAYEKAGYAIHNNDTVRANAARLLANDNVKARIAELQGKAAIRAEISVESLTRRLYEIDKAATEDKQHAAATGALALAARLNGLITDHKTVDIVHHKPARQMTKAIELTEDEWLRLYKPVEKIPPGG